MKIVIRIALALGAMALVGCGGRPLASGKEAAASALFQSSRGASSAQGGLAQVLNAGVTNETEVKVSCPKGGNLALKFTADTTGGSSAVEYTIAYDGCSWDGKTYLKGTLNMTFTIEGTGSSLAMAMHLEGRVDFSGEISDFLDVNVTETVSITDLSSPDASVSLTLTGTITNSTGTYTYSNETIAIDGSGFGPEPAEG